MVETISILIPLIGFVIGYSTNWIAIKMLFHPRKPFFGIQGVVPRRKKELARNIAEAVPHILPDNVKELEKIPFIGSGLFGVAKDAIAKKVESFEEKELEELVMNVVAKELRFVTWLGGFIGLLIGLIQVWIVLSV